MRRDVTPRKKLVAALVLLALPGIGAVATKDAVQQADREMLKMLEFLRQMEMIKQMEMMRDMHHLEESGAPTIAPQKAPSKKAETSK
jgi:hypothetical protein